MAKGKQGFYIEAWKFGVYLLIPITASWWWSDPQRQKRATEYWQFVKYPPSPNTNMKEQIEELAKKQQQRHIYQQQLVELQKQAQRTSEQTQHDTTTQSNQGSWFRWIGLGKS